MDLHFDGNWTDVMRIALICPILWILPLFLRFPTGHFTYAALACCVGFISRVDSLGSDLAHNLAEKIIALLFELSGNPRSRMC